MGSMELLLALLLVLLVFSLPVYPYNRHFEGYPQRYGLPVVLLVVILLVLLF